VKTIAETMLLLCAACTAPAAGQWDLIHPYPQNSRIECFSFSNGADGWFVTADGAIWGSTDGGENWDDQYVAPSWGLKSIDVVDGQFGWAAGEYNEVLKTTDAGSSWIPSTSGTSPGEITDLEFISVLDGWATTGDGGVHRTSDGGATWDTSFQWPYELDDDVYVPAGKIVDSASLIQ